MIKLFVKYYNCNANKIEDYDVLKQRESEIKKLKKKCATKKSFLSHFGTNLYGDFGLNQSGNLSSRKRRTGESFCLLGVGVPIQIP